MCTIYTRVRLFTVLAWNGVKLETELQENELN